MILTFKDLQAATDFLKDDTYLDMGLIQSIHKKWHNHIQKRQCSVCKKTDHRRGNRDLCDGVMRCARCLSTHHPIPTATCEPQCWTHGKGHSSGSEKCSIIIAFKKRQREIHDAKERINLQTAETPSEYQQLHKDILKVQANNNNNSNSYASKLRGGNQANNHAGPAAQPPFQVQTSQFNTTVFAAAYTAASISEAYEPGTFQEVMEEWARANKMPTMKYPTPRLGVLKALAPDAPAVQQADRQAESARRKTPAKPAERTSDSEDDDLGLTNLSHIHYSQTPSGSRPSSPDYAPRDPRTRPDMRPFTPSPPKTPQKTPYIQKAHSPRVKQSPATTRQKSEQVRNKIKTKDLKDPEYCRIIIEQTRSNPFPLTTTPGGAKFLGPNNKVTLECLNEFLTQGSGFMSPSRMSTDISGVPNITRELIEEFAKVEDLKSEEVYFTPYIKTMSEIMQAH